jgi:hypothetical protein
VVFVTAHYKDDNERILFYERSSLSIISRTYRVLLWNFFLYMFIANCNASAFRREVLFKDGSIDM